MPNFKQLVKIDVRKIESLQFEASFSYKMSSNDPEAGLLAPKSYKVQTYLVLPSQFQASPKQYGIDSFYKDLKSYFSFRFPKLSFKEILGIGKGEENSPLVRIENFLANFTQVTPNSEQRSYVFQEAKLWSCSLYYFTDRKCNKLAKLLDKEPELQDVEKIRELLKENSKRMAAILRRWSDIKEKTLAYAAKSSNDISLVDEYVCSVLRDFILKQMDLLWSSNLEPEFQKEINRLSGHLRLLRWYTAKNGYLWVDDGSSNEEKQDFSYRRASLKRSIWSALYIQTQAQSLFKLRRQTGAMLAAAFAGFWAGVAELMIFRSGNRSQNMGASGFIIITALAIAYVLKDRIKEIGRSQFKGGLFGRIPDNQSNMLYSLGSTLKRAINVGTYSETTSYYTSKKVPEDIKERLQQTVDLKENHLHILCYDKLIKLKKKRIHRLNLKVKALYDFFRLNLATLMFYADENEDQCRIPTKDLGVAWTSIPKIYKVDLVMKVSGKSKPKLDAHIEHYQMLVSRQGIHKISPVGFDDESEAID